LFRKVDVSTWEDVLELFQATWKTFGVIHAVISNAGINSENLFKDEIDETGKLKAPSLKSIDVNLVAHIYVAKCAEHYFAKWPETPCQIVMTGSAASFIDTPPLYLYCAAKAGVVGLMRGMRTQLIKGNITVNVIAPWMTSTSFCPSALLRWSSLC
jgi:NAD(P)-dependent dehydrogenase (short-subunit alcohol dehydrogenase family)